MIKFYNVGFEYVVNRPIPPKVCFGSGLEKECLPTKGPAMSSFMRKISGEVRDYPGPFEYYSEKGLLKNYPNKKGYTMLASKTPRAGYQGHKDKIPPIGTYEVDPQIKFRPAYKPFNSQSKRVTLALKNDTPGYEYMK